MRINKRKEGDRIYKIDEAAQLSGLTKRTIRYYEELGLIPPPERSEGGFRLYTDAHIVRLKALTDMRDALGFSLGELQEYIVLVDEIDALRQQYRAEPDGPLKLDTLDRLERKLEDQLIVIDEKLAKINCIRSEVNQLNERIKQFKQQESQTENQE